MDQPQTEIEVIEEMLAGLDPADPFDRLERVRLEDRLAFLRGEEPPPLDDQTADTAKAILGLYADHLASDPEALERHEQNVEAHQEAVREGGYDKATNRRNEQRKAARLVRRAELALARVSAVCQGVRPRSSLGARRSSGTVRRSRSTRGSPTADSDPHEPALGRVPAHVLEALRLEGWTDHQILLWLVRIAVDELQRADNDWGGSQ
jgi:hypothetical protein